jgi:hypothetical protein
MAISRQLAFEVVALVLQGGGALGGSSVGVFESPAEPGIQPNWSARVSVRAVNAAIVAGDPTELKDGLITGILDVGYVGAPWLRDNFSFLIGDDARKFPKGDEREPGASVRRKRIFCCVSIAALVAASRESAA